ncbi:MAG: aminotransferase class I/II-fold pyridoxal phosphate-dependent enzyme, partial [Hyphomicrobiaceae bacterium]
MNTEAAQERLSTRVQAVRPSPTLNMAARTRKLKEEGREVIILSMGEPDFDTEEFIKEAGVAAIRRNETKYTEVSGTREFREALSQKFKHDNGIDYAADQIIVSSGLKPILLNAIYATV